MLLMNSASRWLTSKAFKFSSGVMNGGGGVGVATGFCFSNSAQQYFGGAFDNIYFGNQSRFISSGRSRRGLYNGKDIRTGNNVSFSQRKTKRKFRPNVFKKRVYSEVLDEMVRFHLTASTLRSIDKAGGLDNYIMTSKHVTEGEGLAVKQRIIKKLKWEKIQEGQKK
mmetsp:Transcript_10252/g.15271  ORF Transcript_10252/g.15271 Transcript_10252/m.15271 type:complete len:167 (-) Transcript_10252:322-822(-)